MCDVVTVPIVLGALSLLPDSRYILLALVVVNIANSQCPTQKLERTKHAINACKELLEGTKLTCPRDHVELTGAGASTLRGCVEYVKDMHDIWKKIHQCAKDVKEIETSTLVTMEAEKQRKSGENIRNCNEICDALGSQSSTRRQRRLVQGAGHRKYYRIVRGIDVRVRRNLA
ncbi:hypothetical protein B0H14DRAFT_2583218 [Mycena olivaceomarginata]|nr:hypothetical protein B0H14DRAFT_2583218 [Mycena olivaceomarginata]